MMFDVMPQAIYVCQFELELLNGGTERNMIRYLS